MVSSSSALALTLVALMHVDTTWKFREMIEFRDTFTRDAGLDLIVYTNQ